MFIAWLLVKLLCTLFDSDDEDQAIVHVVWLLCVLLGHWLGYCARCLATFSGYCAYCLATGQAVMFIAWLLAKLLCTLFGSDDGQAIVHVAWSLAWLLCTLLGYWSGYCAYCLATGQAVMFIAWLLAKLLCTLFGSDDGQAIVHVAWLLCVLLGHWLGYCARCLATGQAIVHVA